MPNLVGNGSHRFIHCVLLETHWALKALINWLISWGIHNMTAFQYMEKIKSRAYIEELGHWGWVIESCIWAWPLPEFPLCFLTIIQFLTFTQVYPMSLAIMDWIFWNWAKIIFPLLSCFYQVFSHSAIKLTKSTCEQEQNWALMDTQYSTPVNKRHKSNIWVHKILWRKYLE